MESKDPYFSTVFSESPGILSLFISRQFFLLQQS
jgi:hypothetical protein